MDDTVTRKAGETKKCAECGVYVDKRYNYCPWCGTAEFELPQTDEAARITDKVIRDDDVWICGKCGASNNLELDFCAQCGKEFWPE